MLLGTNGIFFWRLRILLTCIHTEPTYFIKYQFPLSSLRFSFHFSALCIIVFPWDSRPYFLDGLSIYVHLWEFVDRFFPLWAHPANLHIPSVFFCVPPFNFLTGNFATEEHPLTASRWYFRFGADWTYRIFCHVLVNRGPLFCFIGLIGWFWRKFTGCVGRGTE